MKVKKTVPFTSLAEAIREDVKAESAIVYKAYAFDVFREVIIKTPVDTGRARGNWNITTSSPDFRTTSSTTLQNQDNLDLNSFPTVWIANGLEYISELEDGKSTQAPVGITMPALAAVRSRRR
tara:strand:+ start:1107 stop:1475 length:369 start_codon:yes stop_codon:yes gene_type:complete